MRSLGCQQKVSYRAPRHPFAVAPRPITAILWPLFTFAVASSPLPLFFMAGDVIPPPYVIAANDKRGLIVVTGASVLAFVWCCSLIRVWLRWRLKEWRSDGEYFVLLFPNCRYGAHTENSLLFLDWWLAAATLLDTVQTGIILHLVTLGLGASQDNIPLPQREQLGKVSCPPVSRIVLDPHQDVLYWAPQKQRLTV